MFCVFESWFVSHWKNSFHRWQFHLNMDIFVLQGILLTLPCFWFSFRFILKLLCFFAGPLATPVHSALRTLHWQGKRLIHCDKYGSRCQRWRSDKCIVPLPSYLWWHGMSGIVHLVELWLQKPHPDYTLIWCLQPRVKVILQYNSGFTCSISWLPSAAYYENT